MNSKNLNIGKVVAALERMTAKQLRDRYAEVFGETTYANNRIWLVKRIAWRLQAQAEGGLSERALARAAELARDADLRVTAPKERASSVLLASGRVSEPKGDDRLPPPGTIITRKYKGSVIQVQVLTDGFEYAGERYKSLSAVAKVITDSHCNGYLFFRLAGKESAA